MIALGQILLALVYTENGENYICGRREGGKRKRAKRWKESATARCDTL